MNMKKFCFIFLILISLFLTITVISAEDNTTVDNTTSIIKTKVSTPDLGYVYKKNSTLKITVKDKTTKKPVSNLKIKVRVYTGKTSKLRYYTTDSNGIVKLPTKKLKLGSHKFIIHSANSNYSVYKKDNLFIGYKKSVTLKINEHRKLKSGDAIGTIMQNNSGQEKRGVYTDVWYAGVKTDIEPHYTMILKAKLFFKGKKTGKIKTKIVRGKLFTYNGEVYRGSPSTSFIKGYSPYKAKIWFLTSR